MDQFLNIFKIGIIKFIFLIQGVQIKNLNNLEINTIILIYPYN